MTEEQTLRYIAALERQAAAMESQVAATAAAADASTAAFLVPTSRRVEYLACLRAAAEARIENEPAALLKAADDLLAGIDKRFPA